MTSQGSVATAAGLTREDLARAARTRVFFGHQSVGLNILDAVGDVYAAHGMAAPVIEESAGRPGKDGGFIRHAFIGENGKPLLKVEDFAARLRSGLGNEVDVAAMKFCYVDITSTTDVDAVFATYRDTMTALAREFPQVNFVGVTAPLTTNPRFLPRLKRRLAGHGGAADNAARERLNALLRREYAASGLFDLAAIESAGPDGRPAMGGRHERQSYALYDGYAADSGHLNAAGAIIAAIAWLKAIALASRQ